MIYTIMALLDLARGLSYLCFHLAAANASAARLTHRIQRLDSRTVTLFVRMVVALGHRHRLVAGEVVDLLDGDTDSAPPSAGTCSVSKRSTRASSASSNSELRGK